jgi:hypothetical protein
MTAAGELELESSRQGNPVEYDSLIASGATKRGLKRCDGR